MFVLSTDHCRKLGLETVEKGSLVDVGAGCGSVTAEIAPLFSSIATTEASWPMLWRLRSRCELYFCDYGVQCYTFRVWYTSIKKQI